MLDIDAILRPWYESIEAAHGPFSLFDAHTHIGANDPDGFKQTPEELIDVMSRAGVARRRVPDARAGRLLRAERRRDLGGGCVRRPFGRLLPARPARPSGGRGAALPGRGRGRDQAAPARGAVHDGRAGRARDRRGRARASRSRADPRRARDPRAGARHRRAVERVPGRAADPRPRRDLRPRVAVARAARAPERLHRHRVVEPGRPHRAVLARRAVADRVGAATRRTGCRCSPRGVTCAARCRRACPTRRCGRSWAGRSRGWSRARIRCGSATRRARRRGRCTRCSTASSRT